jgi:hypothetical protein
MKTPSIAAAPRNVAHPQCRWNLRPVPLPENLYPPPPRSKATGGASSRSRKRFRFKSPTNLRPLLNCAHGKKDKEHHHTERRQMQRLNQEINHLSHEHLLIGKLVQVHGFARARRLSRGVENLHHDHVGIESGQVALRLQLSVEYGGKVAERVVLRPFEW